MIIRFNGCGIWLLGVGPREHDGARHATMWVTLFFAPIIPLYGVKTKAFRQAGRLAFESIHKEKINWSSVFRTYLYAWILIPLFLALPAFFAVREVQEIFGLPSWLETPFIVLAILWFGVGVWKLKDWDEDRWFTA